MDSSCIYGPISFQFIWNQNRVIRVALKRYISKREIHTKGEKWSTVWLNQSSSVVKKLLLWELRWSNREVIAPSEAKHSNENVVKMRTSLMSLSSLIVRFNTSRSFLGALSSQLPSLQTSSAPVFIGFSNQNYLRGESTIVDHFDTTKLPIYPGGSLSNSSSRWKHKAYGVVWNCFWEKNSIIGNKKDEKQVCWPKLIFYFLFSRIKNIIFKKNIF